MNVSFPVILHHFLAMLVLIESKAISALSSIHQTFDLLISHAVLISTICL